MSGANCQQKKGNCSKGFHVCTIRLEKVITLRVQVPNLVSYTIRTTNLHNYYPQLEYLILGSFGPLGFRVWVWLCLL